MSERLVVVGYAPSHVPGRAPEALLVARRERGRLRFAGRVTTGLGRGGPVRGLAERLQTLHRHETAVAGVPARFRRRAIWLRPELVALVEPGTRDASGLLRAARLLGLERVDEVPSDDTAAPDDATPRRLPPSHPGKLLWPESGLGKADLAAHWEAVATRLMEHARGHAVSLVRHPDGIGRRGFVQRHPAGLPPGLFEVVTLPEADGTPDRYLTLRDAAMLPALARIAVIELHLWGSRADDVDRPDRLVVDLDPDPDLPFPALRAAAIEVREALAGRGLSAFALLTGGRGVHVTAPLRPAAGFPAVARLVGDLADGLARAAPRRYTTALARSARQGRILLDVLRNRRGATAICPWSPRARPGAPVATMLAWDEWEQARSLPVFDLRTIRARLDLDAWPGWRELDQSVVASGAG